MCLVNCLFCFVRLFVLYLGLLFCDYSCYLFIWVAWVGVFSCLVVGFVINVYFGSGGCCVGLLRCVFIDVLLVVCLLLFGWCWVGGVCFVVVLVQFAA